MLFNSKLNLSQNLVKVLYAIYEPLSSGKLYCISIVAERLSVSD